LSEIDGLVKAYERIVKLLWDLSLAGAQKVWFAIYDPSQERRLRLRLDEFAAVTKNAGYNWQKLDLTDSFANWMANHEYREDYFADPEAMEIALDGFAEHVTEEIINALEAVGVDNKTVVAIVGLASLFGLTRASTIFEKASSSIKGRMLVFFPGHHEGNNYRLLDARDGWNYLSIAITADLNN